MGGRPKIQNPKTELIRISPVCKRQLLELRKILLMPSYYKDGDIVEALVRLVRSGLG